MRWPSIIAVLLLAGCARFHPRPIEPMETAKVLDSRTLDNPAFEAFLEKNLQRHFETWPPAAWDFDTLTLAAFYYHPSLEVARAQWQVALGGKVTAAQRPNPTVTASPGYDFSAAGMGVNPWIPGLAFDVPIETMGKRGYRKAQAQHLSDSARWNIAATAWQVRANLRASLLDFTAAQQRASLLEQQDSVQERIVKSLAERFTAGAAASTELALMQTALHKIQLDLTDANRQLADSRVRVADAIGISAKTLDGLELHYDLTASHSAASELLSSEVRDEALQGRADILGALADYAASQSALQLEIAKQYPDIHFGPLYQYNNGDHQFTLSVSAELPVLSQNQGPIAEAGARRTESAARFIALQAKVITEIDRAVAVYRATQDNLATLEALAADQKKQSEAVDAQAKAGAADGLDLLNAQLELSAGALVQLDGRIKAEQAFGALEDAMQRPLAALKPEVIEPQQAQAKKKEQP